LVKLVGRTLGQAVAVPALGAASAVRVSMSEAAELLSSGEASPVTPVAAPRPAPVVSLNTMPPSQLIDWAPPTPPNVAASLGRGAVGFPQVRATNDDLGAGPKSRAELFNELRAFYAEALEYPPEVFSEEVTLEADLGVDSVKQTELFARTVERYQLTMPTDDMQLSDYDTMGKVVEMIWSLLPSQSGASGIGAVV
jgi:acyl carrier protein